MGEAEDSRVLRGRGPQDDPSGKAGGVPKHYAKEFVRGAGVSGRGGDDRIYQINFEAVDPREAKCSGEIRVHVPHDQSDGCIEGVEIHDATSCPEQ